MLSKFKIRVILHLAIMLVIMALGAYFIPRGDAVPISVLLLIGFTVSLISLFRLVNRTNKNLANFLQGIKYDDFSTKYKSTQQEVSEDALFNVFNEINYKFQDIRLEKEIQFEYFQSLLEQVDTGLIGFDDAGNTIFMNRALKQMLRKSYISSFDTIKKFDAAMWQTLSGMNPGDRELLRREVHGEVLELAIEVTKIGLRGRTLSFFSFQNIYAELQEQEINSWHKLIRILTHEIMNSVTPVVSLAHAINDLLKDKEQLTHDEQEEVRAAVDAIERRGEGLLNFTSAYRKLAKLPPPSFREADATRLMDRIAVLFEPTASERGIKLIRLYSDEPRAFTGDPDMLEQALVNLVKNAFEAVSMSGKREVGLDIDTTEMHILLRVKDSGPGISTEVMDEIFVPFFTTKSDGSGIGLSLSRQIVQKHGGVILVNSGEGEGAEFVIKVPRTQVASKLTSPVDKSPEHPQVEGI